MHKERIPLSLIFVLSFSLSGFLFSGYLVFAKLFTGACAWSEACPMLFGQPACWYGLVFFVALLALAVFIFQKRLTFRTGMIAISLLSFLGIIFSGFLTFEEISVLMSQGFGTHAGTLPTCAFGLIFFMLIFVSSALGLAHYRED